MSGHWLMKSEPDAFGIDDLARVGVEPWTGVRNYTARNLMRDRMQVGDRVLFYHSNASPPGVAGLARVVRTGVVDDTQFDPGSPYHDPGSRRDQPRWVCVDVEFVEKLPRLVALDELRTNPALAGMMVLQRGMRLSVQPVDAEHFEAVVAMSRRPPPPAAGRRAAKPAVKQPAVKRPAVKRPAVKRPAANKPAVNKPAANKPAARKPPARAAQKRK